MYGHGDDAGIAPATCASHFPRLVTAPSTTTLLWLLPATPVSPTLANIYPNICRLNCISRMDNFYGAPKDLANILCENTRHPLVTGPASGLEPVTITICVI